MRHLPLLAVLLLPSVSNAYVNFNFSGLVDDKESEALAGQSFSGSFQVDDNFQSATGGVAGYSTDNQFQMTVADLNIIRPGSLRWTIGETGVTCDLYAARFDSPDPTNPWTQIYIGFHGATGLNDLDRASHIRISSRVYKDDLPYQFPEFNGTVNSFSRSDSQVAQADGEAPVPEPASMILTALGLGVFGLWRRRQS